MNRLKVSLVTTCISIMLLLIFACAGNLITNHANAQGNSGTKDKISSDLRDLAHGAAAGSRVTVIVQFNNAPGNAFDSLLLAQGGRVKARLGNLKMHVLELPARAAEALAARPEVGFISLDRENIAFGHISSTTGADAVRTTNGTNTNGLDGTGIGIAVLDSGIDTTHTAFLDRSNNVRVIFSKDFTGENRVDDPYGHGTHVASIAAGNARISNAQYTGIAPNANIINLRVLGAT
ncbi:MAG TPA: S8 family serine peptidase, partial [Pyrinomonadaceae bacterium]|nr:S8 family serine peptidase [Pyrinomonadaceae bacterium]